MAATRARIDAAHARSAFASPGSVTLVTVTKAAPPGGIDLLASLGREAGPELGGAFDSGDLIDVGENRVADAAAKRAAGPRNLRWHGIGHLQTNKARKAVETFQVFHALDSLHLADRLETILAEQDRALPVYAQVNAANDPAKSGVPCEEAIAFLRALADRRHLDVVGLMTMAPLAEGDGDLASARAAFAALRALRDEAVRNGVGRVPAAGLSMGMSDDFEVAVEEGATCVRVGRLIWTGVEPTSDDSLAAAHGTADDAGTALSAEDRRAAPGDAETALSAEDRRAAPGDAETALSAEDRRAAPADAPSAQDEMPRARRN